MDIGLMGNLGSDTGLMGNRYSFGNRDDADPQTDFEPFVSEAHSRTHGRRSLRPGSEAHRPIAGLDRPEIFPGRTDNSGTGPKSM